MSRYTAAEAFFEALWEVTLHYDHVTGLDIDDEQLGITYCFVNLGSDHPSLIEAIAKGQKEKPLSFLKIITCPNEVSRHVPS